MPREGLDEKDQAILRELRRDCRIPISRLAKIKEISLANTPCKQRIKRLERLGYISSYTIKENKDGKVISTKFMFLEISSTRKSDLEEVEKTLMKHPSVSMVCLIEGTFDYLVRIDEGGNDRTIDIIKELREFITIKDTMTFSVIEHVYER